MDGDYVEVRNIHRQIVHNCDNINVNKAISAKKICEKLNPLVITKKMLFML